MNPVTDQRTPEVQAPVGSEVKQEPSPRRRTSKREALILDLIVVGLLISLFVVSYYVGGPAVAIPGVREGTIKAMQYAGIAGTLVAYISVFAYIHRPVSPERQWWTRDRDHPNEAQAKR